MCFLRHFLPSVSPKSSFNFTYLNYLPSAILQIRVYAFYLQSKKILAFTLSLYVATAVVAGFSAAEDMSRVTCKALFSTLP